MSKAVVRSAVVGATCAVAGSLAFGFHAQNTATASGHEAAAWQAESLRWERVARTAVRHDRGTTRENQRIAASYNRLVRDTRRSERDLLAALRRASKVTTVRGAQQTIYRTVASSSAGSSSSSSGSSGGGSPAPSAPAAAPSAPAPNPPSPPASAPS